MAYSKDVKKGENDPQCDFMAVGTVFRVMDEDNQWGKRRRVLLDCKAKDSKYAHLVEVEFSGKEKINERAAALEGGEYVRIRGIIDSRLPKDGAPGRCWTSIKAFSCWVLRDAEGNPPDRKAAAVRDVAPIEPEKWPAPGPYDAIDEIPF